MHDDLDVVIVGAGPAGMSAALWARTLELRYEVIDDAPAPGGQLHRVYNHVVDYPGVDARHGAELAEHLSRHLDGLDVRIRSGAAVTAIDVAARSVESGYGSLRARHLVLATGVRRRTLGVPGEAELVGRGVSPSASKYASQFSGQRVLVVGGGDAALEEALILAKVCERVTIVNRTERFRARPDFRDRVAADPRIVVHDRTELLAINGGDRVTGVELRGTDGPYSLDVAGVFVCVGVLPNSDLVAQQVAVDERGYVRTDERQRTSADGVYAAGDVCSGSSLTIAAAVGQGAAAVKDVQRRLAAAR